MHGVDIICRDFLPSTINHKLSKLHQEERNSFLVSQHQIIYFYLPSRLVSTKKLKNYFCVKQRYKKIQSKDTGDN